MIRSACMAALSITAWANPFLLFIELETKPSHLCAMELKLGIGKYLYYINTDAANLPFEACDSVSVNWNIYKSTMSTFSGQVASSLVVPFEQLQLKTCQTEVDIFWYHPQTHTLFAELYCLFSCQTSILSHKYQCLWDWKKNTRE